MKEGIRDLNARDLDKLLEVEKKANWKMIGYLRPAILHNIQRRLERKELVANIIPKKISPRSSISILPNFLETVMAPQNYDELSKSFSEDLLAIYEMDTDQLFRFFRMCQDEENLRIILKVLHVKAEKIRAKGGSIKKSNQQSSRYAADPSLRPKRHRN